MSHIVPRSKAPGTDFCGMQKYHYIVRSDLGCYMRSTDFNHGYDLEVFGLHYSCSGGDHYVAGQDGLFYIIKGNSYRQVTNMTEDSNAKLYTLHPNCCGGDHYFRAYGYFYIVFQTQGILRQVKNLKTGEDAIDGTLHPDCRNGLYYWATLDLIFFVKPQDEWGAQYVRSDDLCDFQNPDIYSFHTDVVNMLPGGLGITQGPAFGRWEAIKTICNDSPCPIEWNKKITKTIGYTKQKMSSLELNWKVDVSASVEPGDLIAEIVKFQFSMSADFGGSSVHTEQEEWSEATEVEESVDLTLKPGESVYIWQFHLGLGKESVLFCRYTKFTGDSTPPSDVPLPPSNK